MKESKLLYRIASITLVLAIIAGALAWVDPLGIVSYGKNMTIYPIWDDSIPQEENATETDPGSTLSTWDYSRSYDYPDDAKCTPDEFFEKWMAVEGVTVDDLEARGAKQLIIVASKVFPNHETTLTCYQRQASGKWKAVDGLTALNGTMGRNGLNHDRVQGDETSPGGLWQLGTCFGNESKPSGLKMPWRDITPESVWVGKNCRYYNTWQEIDKITDVQLSYGNGEHLVEYTSSYALACVVRFNMYPYTVRGKGSGIFFHVSTSGTAGCIGLPYELFKRCILWLNPADNPYMLITGFEA